MGAVKEIALLAHLFSGNLHSYSWPNLAPWDKAILPFGTLRSAASATTLRATVAQCSFPAVHPFAVPASLDP
jgi:hypothetical protein